MIEDDLFSFGMCVSVGAEKLKVEAGFKLVKM